MTGAPAAPGAAAGPAFVGAVLTGGASRRMGTAKAELDMGGRPMAVRVADALRAAGAASVASVGLPVPGEEHLPDEHPGEGPLGGVLTALRWAGDRTVVVLACDLLVPAPAPIARAVAALAADRAAVAAVPVVGDHRQWLHAAWRPPLALGPLQEAFAAGVRSIHGAARPLRLATYAEVEPLADADRPGDLPR